VKTHLANIYTKLRVSNRVEAAAWLQSKQTGVKA
jgi:DNA-binding CsgD family transcriptional regulator